MPALTRRSDVLLVHLRDSALFSITIPSKIQSCLAMGRPVLAAVTGDAARLVERSGAGFVCGPGQPDRLAEAAFRMAKLEFEERDAMGTKGRDFYLKELSIVKGIVRFEQVLLNAVWERNGQRGSSMDPFL